MGTITHTTHAATTATPLTTTHATTTGHHHHDADHFALMLATHRQITRARALTREADFTSALLDRMLQS